MKNIQVNYLTYYLLLVYLLCGLFKEAILSFLIVIIHELGHVFFLKLYKYKIISINIYPFGGITKIDKKINTPFISDILVSLGGFIFQILLHILFFYLYQNNIITTNTYTIFTYYNKLILLFNVLPIHPLDGFKVLSLLIEEIIPYKSSITISIILSFITLILFVKVNIDYSINNYLIISFLIYKAIEYLKNKKYMYNKFLLERYLYTFKAKKVVNTTLSLYKIKKNIYYFFYSNNSFISEKLKLSKKFISK